MSRRRTLVSLALALALAVGAPVAGAATPPTCTKGTVGKASVGRVLQARIDAGRQRLERSLTGVPTAQVRAAGRTYATGVMAWLYGFPVLMQRRTILSYPRNSMVSIGVLAKPSTATVVAPNHDTLYSIGQLDLTDGPIVVHTPSTGGRYSVIQLTDLFTNVAGYVGDGAAARTGETVLVAGPGWKGTAPAGMRVVRVASDLVWLLGRTLAQDAADEPAARALLAQYSVTPLADYQTGVRRPATLLADFPAGRDPIRAPQGLPFFDELGAALAADPPPARDACALRAFAAAGIGPGHAPSTEATGPAGAALTAAAADGPGILTAIGDAQRSTSGGTGGWSVFPRNTARFGTDYLTRAIVASIGLGANTVEKAIYPTAVRDSRGRALTGVHDYTVRFAKGQLPPVRQFWSLTLYDERVLFYDNPLQRFALGDRSPGLRRAKDGSLTIHVSHTDPGAARRANWLPAPTGVFSLYLRLYEPTAAAQRGRWTPPAVRRVR